LQQQVRREERLKTRRAGYGSLTNDPDCGNEWEKQTRGCSSTGLVLPSSREPELPVALAIADGWPRRWGGAPRPGIVRHTPDARRGRKRERRASHMILCVQSLRPIGSLGSRLLYRRTGTLHTSGGFWIVGEWRSRRGGDRLPALGGAPSSTTAMATEHPRLRSVLYRALRTALTPTVQYGFDVGTSEGWWWGRCAHVVNVDPVGAAGTRRGARPAPRAPAAPPADNVGHEPAGPPRRDGRRVHSAVGRVPTRPPSTRGRAVLVGRLAGDTRSGGVVDGGAGGRLKMTKGASLPRKKPKSARR